MKFSIILPVRNGGNMVKECVSSILNQTYRQFNLIILDSGSTDDTLNFIKSLDDSRIELYTSASPLTIEENWHRILEVKKNEFITLIGHDDLLMSDYLETMNNLIEENPLAGLYQTHFNFINGDGSQTGECKSMPSLMQPEEFVEKALQLKIDLNGTGYMCRSVTYDEVGGIPIYPRLLYSDYALWFSIVSKGPVAVAKGRHFSYRIHQNTSQTTNTLIYSKALGQFVEFLKNKKNDTLLKKAIEQYAPEFIAHYCKSISHKMLRVKLKERNGTGIYQFVQTCNVYCKELSGNNQHAFLPGDLSLRLAIFVDSNPVTRLVFRWFKKIYKKPVL